MPRARLVFQPPRLTQVTQTAPTSHADVEKKARQRRQVLGADGTITTWTAVGVLALVLGILSWGLIDLIRRDSHVLATAPSQTLTLVGFLLTGGALVVALLIYQVQKQETENDRTSNKKHGAKVLEEVAEVKELLSGQQAKQVASDLKQVDGLDDQVDDNEQDPYQEEVDAKAIPTEELVAIGADREQAARFKVYSPTQIPIRVLADLYTGWGELLERGELDNEGVANWEAGEAVAYRRRQRGNHAWFIRMTDRDDPDNTYLWQVSRGGRAKAAPTVRQLSP